MVIRIYSTAAIEGNRCCRRRILWFVDVHDDEERTGIVRCYIQYWLGGGLERNETSLLEMIDILRIGGGNQRHLGIGVGRGVSLFIVSIDLL